MNENFLRRTGIWIASFLFHSVFLVARAADFYVAPTGGTNGTGSLEQPWDLQTALTQPAGVKPGDTIWLRGGIYSRSSPYCLGFQSWLKGTPDAPIIVRPYAGERAILQEPRHYTCPNAPDILLIVGSDTWYWGLEVRSTNAARAARSKGSGPDWEELPLPSSVSVAGPGNKLINLIVHDTRGGLGFWAAATNSEAYGCLVYNNGFAGPDRGHGHGIYCQNRDGLQKFTDNIIFNQFGLGIHGYTENSALKHFLVQRNIIFNNGRLAGDSHTAGEQVLFGSPKSKIAVEDLRLLDNCVYLPADVTATALMRPDYGSCTKKDLTMTGNYLAAGGPIVSARGFDSLIFTGNLLYSATGPLLRASTGAGSIISNNAFYCTGCRTKDDFITAVPPDKVFVHRNNYEPKRAHITVFNWSNSDVVRVDVGNVLCTGDRYEVRNAQDYFAPPVLAGTFTGQPLDLPLTNLNVVAPTGWKGLPRGKEFNVFVLSGTATPAPTK